MTAFTSRSKRLALLMGLVAVVALMSLLLPFLVSWNVFAGKTASFQDALRWICGEGPHGFMVLGRNTFPLCHGCLGWYAGILAASVRMVLTQRPTWWKGGIISFVLGGLGWLLTLWLSKWMNLCWLLMMSKALLAWGLLSLSGLAYHSLTSRSINHYLKTGSG